MEKRKSRSCKLFLLCMAFAIIFGLFMAPKTAQAAVSSSTKAKAVKAYKSFLYESDFRYFKLFDINKDGLKELIVSNEAQQGKISSAQFYTYRSGKVKCLNRNVYSMFGITYNSKTKRLCGSRGGGGAVENWYYTIKSNGKLGAVYLWTTTDPKPKYYYAGKKITKKKYLSISASWRKYRKPLKVYKVSKTNIKKYCKM